MLRFFKLREICLHGAVIESIEKIIYVWGVSGLMIVRDPLSGEGYVIKTVFRKVTLCACMGLTFTSGLPVGLLRPAPAYAQTTPNYDQLLATLPRGLQQSIASKINSPLLLAADLQSGLSQGASTEALLAAIRVANPSMDAERLTNMGQLLTNISANPNINAISANALLTGFLGDRMPAGATSLLSTIDGLGNLNASQFMQIMNTEGFQDFINNLPREAAADFLNTFIATGLSAEGLAQLNTEAGIEVLRDLIDAQLPDLADFMREFGGIRELLGSTLAGLLAGGPGAILGTVLGTILNGLLGGFLGGGGGGCCSRHRNAIPRHYDAVRQAVDTGFDNHRTWFVTVFWEQNLLPALALFASQMTATGMLQVQMIGTMLDAKHQLETQRIFQTMMAQAHKDYQPSEQMCTFGTMARGLAVSERLSDLTQIGLTDYMAQRQTLSAGAVSRDGEDSDKRSRLAVFRPTHCEPADNGNGLGSLCPNPGEPGRRNIDVDYIRNIESRLTLDLNLRQGGTPTPDMQDVIAFLSYVFSNVVAPRIPPGLFGSDGRIRMSVAEKYMQLRAIFAKRSVGQNSMAALISLRASGDSQSAPYVKAHLRNMGMAPEEIERRLGENPSTLAIMDVSSNLISDAGFVTRLYDTPANVARTTTAINVGILRMDRFFLESLLRSEMILAVLLETMLQKEQEKVTADIELISKVEN